MDGYNSLRNALREYYACEAAGDNEGRAKYWKTILRLSAVACNFTPEMVAGARRLGDRRKEDSETRKSERGVQDVVDISECVLREMRESNSCDSGEV